MAASLKNKILNGGHIEKTSKLRIIWGNEWCSACKLNRGYVTNTYNFVFCENS
jgi:hypothetical protein